ncbi:MAG: glycosyltransferase, partial [Anaerolineae bacterium]|nr:glycosyltransferase [Anaerolineae bacterium]
DILRQQGDIDLQTVSIRYPVTLAAELPEYKAARDTTLYLTPVDKPKFLIANFYLLFRRPWVYLSTLTYLMTRQYSDLSTRLLTFIHFLFGVYAAYLLRHRDFQHFHVHFIDRAVVVALLAGRLLNKSYSLTAHANSIFVKKILIREKILNAKFMVTVSKHNKAHLLNNYEGIDADKIYIFHPWVDLSRFTPPEKRPCHDKLHIFSVGRLVEKKGHRYLIEACNYLREHGIEFECRIAGHGPLMAEFETLIDKHNLRDCVVLMGGRPQEEIIEHLATWADVFVLPCVIAKDGDRDGIPVALAEAMAMELPVISSDIVGVSELVQPGTGILTAPHAPEAVAEALCQIYAMPPEARLALGRSGRAVVDAEFNLPKGTGELADLFREMLTT